LIPNPNEIRLTTPSTTSGDWLQNITLYLLNRTDKNIVHGTITLVFPETGAGTPGSPVTVATIGFGQLPPGTVVINGHTRQPMVATARPDVKPVLLAPGQTMAVALQDFIEQIKRVVDPNVISRVIIRRSAVFFDDGMRWAGNSYSTADREHPGKWINLDPSYFPGRPDWPPRENK
jgi:hypothetical protein